MVCCMSTHTTYHLVRMYICLPHTSHQIASLLVQGENYNYERTQKDYICFMK